MPARLVSFRLDQQTLDALADPSNLAGIDENDPKGTARWMRKMGAELGEE